MSRNVASYYMFVFDVFFFWCSYTNIVIEAQPIVLEAKMFQSSQEEEMKEENEEQADLLRQKTTEQKVSENCSEICERLYLKGSLEGKERPQLSSRNLFRTSSKVLFQIFFPALL